MNLPIAKRCRWSATFFRTDWARDGTLQRFDTAVRAARQLLLDRDSEWARLRPLMRVRNAAAFDTLRRRYRDGIPRHWGTAERASAAQLFEALVPYAGRILTGAQRQLADGTFWDGVRY